MVRGNKFKPGLPPLKKRKTQEADTLGLQNSISVQAHCSTGPALDVSQKPQPLVSKPSTNAARLAGTETVHGKAAGKRKHIEPLGSPAAANPGLHKRQKQASVGGPVSRKLVPPILQQDLQVQNKLHTHVGIRLAGESTAAAPPTKQKAHAPRGNHSTEGRLAGRVQTSSKTQHPDDMPQGRSKAALRNQRKKARQRAERLAAGASREVVEADGVEGKAQKVSEQSDAAIGIGESKGSGGAGPPKEVSKGEKKQRRKHFKGGKADTEAAALPGGSRTVLQPPRPGTLGNSNWASLKGAIGAGRRPVGSLKGTTPQEGSTAKRPEALGPSSLPTRILAVDCEMVGVGPQGMRSSLARVCVVNDQGNVLMDKFVQQKERVRDYRTRWSGIRPEDVHGGGAEPFAVVQKEVADVFKDRVVVGHAIQNDLKALLLSHPSKMVRDTARFPPLMQATQAGRKPKARALRHLAFEVLGLGIQEGEHSPVEDARCALYLYQRHAKVWEHHLQKGSMHLLKAPGQVPEGKGGGGGKTFAQLAAKDVMVDL